MNGLRHFWARYRANAAWMILLAGLALCARLPELYTIPRFTDEVLEWKFAYEIARGARTPLQGLQPYLGPFASDLLAGALLLAPNPLTPRAWVAVLGALTAPATYALGAVIGGRRVGILAGLLMVAASTHIVVNSHIAYVNALTPLFTALTLTFVYAARTRSDGRFLVVGGFLFGLTAQTHPLALALLPGIIGWFFSAREQWQWLRRPSLYLASGAALVAYSPVLFALFSQPEFFRAQVVTRSYAFALPQSAGEYAGNVQGLVVELARMLGAAYPNLDAPREYLAQLPVLVYAFLAAGALWAMAVRHDFFLLWVIGSVGLCIPFINKQYGDFPYFTRYTAFLLPPLYVAAGLGLDTVWTKIASRHFFARARWPGRALACLFVAWLVWTPLQLTSEFYASQQRGARTNARFLEMMQHIAQTSPQPVLLDNALGEAEFPSGGNLLLTFQVWLDLSGRPWRGLDMNARSLPNCAPEQWLFIEHKNVPRIAARCRMEKVLEQEMPTRPGRPQTHFVLYRMQGVRAD